MPLLLLCTLTIATTTDLTFVRHGETIANATGKYNSQTIDTFSKKGQDQVARLTRDLLVEQPYDVILVSPSPRAMNSIAPYLKAKGKVGTVWPLLYECCTEKRPANAKATSFNFGVKIAIPTAISGQLKIGTLGDRYPAPKGYNEGLAQVAASVAEFKKKFLGKRVLIVGHSGAGGQFIKAFTGKAIRLENASPLKFRF
ncbi:MAG: histidine phosphatase family protein [Armatimonadota bacterium]